MTEQGFEVFLLVVSAVGGVAIVATVGLGIWFFVSWLRARSKEEPEPAEPEPAELDVQAQIAQLRAMRADLAFIGAPLAPTAEEMESAIAGLREQSLRLDLLEAQLDLEDEMRDAHARADERAAQLAARQAAVPPATPAPTPTPAPAPAPDPQTPAQKRRAVARRRN